MYRLTYKNLCRAIRMIEAKGYSREEADRLARCCFTENRYAFPAEHWIAQIIPKREYDALHHPDRPSFDGTGQALFPLA